MAKWLIELQSDCNQSNLKEDSPLRLAVWLDMMDLVREMDNQGANLQEVNESSESLLHEACWNESYDMVQFLLS